MPHVYAQYKREKNEELVKYQEEKIKEYLRKQLCMFHQAWLQFDDWKYVVEDNDKDDLYTNKDIFVLHNQCKYLYFSLSFILQHFTNTTIRDCLN